MNAGARERKPNILSYPVAISGVPPHEPPRVVDPSWIIRRLEELGVVTMANTDPRPPGFYFNYSTALFYITIIALIAGGWWWSWQQADANGFARGKQESELQRLQGEVQKAQADAAEAKKLGIYATREVDNGAGHAKPNKK